MDSLCRGWVKQNKVFHFLNNLSYIYIYYINNLHLFMRTLGVWVQIWSLNVAVLMMWSWKCEIPTDVHDSHSTVAMAQLFPGKMSMDFSLSGFLTAHIWSIANNNYRFLFWPEFMPPGHLKQHPEAAESSSTTFCFYLLFLKNPFPEHCERKAGKVHLQQIPCTEVKILNYSPRAKSK